MRARSVEERQRTQTDRDFDLSVRNVERFSVTVYQDPRPSTAHQDSRSYLVMSLVVMLLVVIATLLAAILTVLVLMWTTPTRSGVHFPQP